MINQVDPHIQKAPLRKKILQILLILIPFLIVLFLSIALYRTYQSTQLQKQELDLAYNTLHQIIANNEKLYDALELEKPIFSLDLKQKNIQNDGEAETFLTLAEELQDNFLTEKQSILLTSEIIDSQFQENVNNLGFEFLQQNTGISIRLRNNIVATISSHLDSEARWIEKYSIQSSIIDSQILTDIEAVFPLLSTLSEMLEENLKQSQELKQEIIQEFSSKVMRDFVKKNSITIEYKNSSELQEQWYLKNQLNELVISISLKHLPYELLINENKIRPKNVDSRISRIRNSIYQSSYNTKQEKANLRYIARLRDLFRSRAYKEKLQAQNLAVQSNYTSDTDYHYFNLLTIENSQEEFTKIGAFAVQKNNGELWIMDKDDVPLRSVTLSIGREELNYREKVTNTAKNILLLGTHNDLADTIILLHITDAGQIKLISIPRDLYFAGQKINWYSKYFSYENLLHLIEDITGLPIDNYVAIDMYAFVTVIDILEGITIFLEEDIIDPSYRIKENGRWSYLNYPKGEYTLNGIEALRIARSRYTSSDFSRSDRQKILLEGIRNKIDSLSSFTSVLSAIEILTKIRKNISTDLKVIEIATLIMQHKNATIDSKLTLSTANILYYTYTELHKAKISLDEYKALDNDPDIFLGNYILLPRNDDWNTLKKYIEQYILN